MGFQNMCKSHRGTLGINHFDSFTFLETPFFTTLFSYDLSAKCKQKSKHLRISSEKRKQKRYMTELLLESVKKIQKQYYEVFCGVHLFCDYKHVEKFNLFGLKKSKKTFEFTTNHWFTKKLWILVKFWISQVNFWAISFLTRPYLLNFDENWLFYNHFYVLKWGKCFRRRNCHFR